MDTGLEEAWKPLSLTTEDDMIVESDDTIPHDYAEQVALCLWGNILLLKELTGFEQLSEVKFSNVQFWVKALDVPPLKQTSSFAKILGDNLGVFVGCDEPQLFCAMDKSVNFQVESNDSSKGSSKPKAKLSFEEPSALPAPTDPNHSIVANSVDYKECSGRIALLWKKTLHVTLLSMSLNHVDVTVQVGGDINEIWYNYENKGGLDKPQFILDSFRDTFSSCELYDMGYSGYAFTWWNRQDGEHSVEECLNRFCTSIKWLILFPSAKCFYIDVKLSDHLSIQMKFRNGDAGYRNGVLDPSLVSAVKGKIVACSKALSQWNVSTFGNIQGNSQTLEPSPREASDISSREKILEEICDWRRKEEILWYQRARLDFLRHKDSNSKWSLKKSQEPSSSISLGVNPWKLLWSLDVLPRIKMFGWKMLIIALATQSSLARCLKDFNMACHICGALEDNTTHALLECPLAVEIWAAGLFKSDLRTPSIADHSPSTLAGRAVAFVKGFRDAKLSLAPSSHHQVSIWSPLDPGRYRLNFDTASNFPFLKRDGNRVAHEAAHIQPPVSGPKIWTEDMPLSIITLASTDMCTFLDNHLI
ncbi:hypothetical protein Cgig2_008689 [Carnegiea gigantea]|uniref:Reverse transcriptase zinc-binding domain-containing protein n=1 Tax=Carnegiea gigantea TaxID=171969 RepID=A0A9Q1JWY6_9CARY|nr:hypothetical protein Cgig2_020927 [Carnegiea gigantea]KAJ8432604.1 hypothetical protein Cgig2_008689 [Carnegiea gigantea]